MKKIGIFIIAILSIVTIMNIWQIRNHIHTQRGIGFFKHWNFKKASKEFQKVKDITSLYNDANSLYKQWKFEEAIQKYWLLNTWNNILLDFYQYYNKGNSLYEQWIQNPTHRAKLRKQAISSYDFALSLQDDEDTKYNKSVIEKALKQLQKTEQKEKQNDSSNNNNSQSGNNNKNWSNWNNHTSTQWSWGQESQNNHSQDSKNSHKTNKQWTSINSINSWNNENSLSQNKTWVLTNTWSMESLSWMDQNHKNSWTGATESWSISKQSSTNQKNNQQNSQNSNTPLSQEQLQAIQNYKKQLSNQQKQYGQYYNKKYKKDNDDPFQDFFNDPFFDNRQLNWDNSDKKDW